MPNYFSLTRKGDQASGPVRLPLIDYEIREYFGVVQDHEAWYAGWYGTIGLALALGHTWDSMLTIYSGPQYLDTADVIEYLRERFVPDAWHEPK